jgi:hypothetical protein
MPKNPTLLEHLPPWHAYLLVDEDTDGKGAA